MGNPGRSFDPSCDLTEAFKDHIDPALAKERCEEIYKRFGKKAKPMTEAQRKEMGWDTAYDLRPWHEFPDTDRLSVPSVVLQNVTLGIFGAGGGPDKESIDLGVTLRKQILQ